ncbi:MAG: hypothetical protein ABUT20_19580 [Bacteroidota bacterium]
MSIEDIVNLVSITTPKKRVSYKKHYIAMISGNPGEQLILFVFYISVFGIVGALLVYLWIKIHDFFYPKPKDEIDDSQQIEAEENQDEISN